eukprot:5201052-Pleurochrysis_carterae.AAC.2
MGSKEGNTPFSLHSGSDYGNSRRHFLIHFNFTSLPKVPVVQPAFTSIVRNAKVNSHTKRGGRRVPCAKL